MRRTPAIADPLEGMYRRIAASLDPAKVFDEPDADELDREREETERQAWERTERSLCAADPYYWIEQYGWMIDEKEIDPEKRFHRIKLWPEQRVVIERILAGYYEADDRLVNKGRELGVTWICLHLLLWLFLFEEKFSALLTSKDEDAADDLTIESLMGKIDFLLERQPVWLKPETYRRKHLIRNLDNSSRLRSKPASESLGRSHRFAVVFSDEWAALKRRKQRGIRLSLESVARSWWRVSTPAGRGDDFHLSWVRAPKSHKIQLRWTADPRRDQEWWDGLLNENGGNLTADEREREHNCGFGAVLGERVIFFDRERQTFEDSELPPNARKLLFQVGAGDFGTGPSWTVILFLLVDWDRSPHAHYPLIYVDLELIWSRTSAEDIASDILAFHEEHGYSESMAFVGDPSGTSAESDQESWESRLNDAGVPMLCLDSLYNTHEVLYQTSLDRLQNLLNLGLLKISEKRCPITCEALESWEWDIPEGVDSRFLSREVLKPRKDGWSHPADALRYGIEWICREARTIQAKQEVVEKMTRGPMGGVSRMIDRARKF
jgi:hypothetical protein